jgi:hypothetical protein
MSCRALDLSSSGGARGGEERSHARERTGCQEYRTIPVRTTAPAGAEAVDEERFYRAQATRTGYGVGGGGSDKRVKLVTSIVRNIGVRGGSSDGVRKSSSNVNARFGAPYTLAQHL